MNRQNENPAQINNWSLVSMAGKDKSTAMANVTSVRGQPISGADRFRNPAKGNGELEKWGHHAANKNAIAAIQASAALPFNGFIGLSA
jgi:hypothetical protein